MVNNSPIGRKKTNHSYLMKQKNRFYTISLLFVLILACWLNVSAIAKPLIITNSATFPPFSFLDDEGNPQGLFIDLWNEWARKNNHEIEFLLVDWNDSLELVRKGEADIHAGLFQSETRKSFMDFSGELFQLTTGLFISTNLNIQSIDELKGVEIGVTKGGFEEEYLRSEFKYLHLRLYDNNENLVKSASSGEIDAFVADYPVGMYYLHRYKAPENFRILKILYSNTLYSAVQKGDEKLLAQVDNGLQQIDKDDKERILQKWIRSEQVLPSWFTPFLAIAGIFIILCGLLLYVYTLRRNKIHLKRLVDQRTNELKKSEARFRHLVRDLPKIAVQGYDSDRTITYWNRASEILYGYSRKEAMGKKLEDLIVPASMKDPVISAIHNWYEHDVEIPSSELVLKHKDGSDVAVYSSHVMLSTREAGKEMYCVDLDLADLKEAQEKEQESESFYRQLFEHSSSGVAVYEAVDSGQDFIFKDFNAAGEKIDNINRDTMLGHRITEIFPGIEEFGLLDVLRQVWQTGEPALHPVSLYKDEKIQGWRENRVYKLPTGEVVSVYDDITKEKQLEEEKHTVEIKLERAQKMEALGLLAGGVAHDLNNILTGITGYPELMLLQLPDESDLRKPIKAIKKSGERAAAVVADLLTVARGVASSKTVNNMNTMISEYLDSPECHHLKFQHQHIECLLELEDDLPNIFCSPVHIKKCVMNLVTNAVEAMDRQGTLTLSTTSVHPAVQWAKENGLDEKEYVVFTVTDTGKGISGRDIDHIFEPFYTKKVMGRSGTGLGLAVVWNAVEDHKGRIFVKSSDKGTSFQLYFPISNKEGVEQTANSQKEELAGNNEHILVVDDETQLQDIACQMLQISGYRVDSVSSGELAIAFIKENPVDLIVLDMLMEPGINGYQTYKEILRHYPDQKAIIASGFSESDDVKATIKLGANGFIKKPYTMDSLGRAVKVALSS